MCLSPEQRVERERADDAVQRPLPHQQPLSAVHRGLALRQPAAQTLPQTPQLRIILAAHAATGRGEPGLQTRRRGGGAHRGPSARHCLLSRAVCVCCWWWWWRGLVRRESSWIIRKNRNTQWILQALTVSHAPCLLRSWVTPAGSSANFSLTFILFINQILFVFIDVLIVFYWFINHF